MPSPSPSASGNGGLRQPLIPVTNPGGQRLTIDDMLVTYCGEFGQWQFRHFILTSLAWALEGFHTMVMIFADQEPRWRCSGSVPGCTVHDSAPPCGLQSGLCEWVDGPGRSTVSEWGLICGDKYKVGLAQAVFFTGCMIGAGIFGHLSDSSLGRKRSLAIVCALNGLFGCLTSLSPTYYVYTLIRFLTGLSTGGVGLCAFVLATEPIGPSKRGVAGMSTFYFFSGGIAFLCGIAYIFPSWRALYVASSLPSIFFTALIIPFLSESPIWYIVRGKTKEAMTIMRKIAKCNGKHLPQDVELILDDDNLNNQTLEDETTTTTTPGADLTVVLLQPFPRNHDSRSLVPIKDETRGQVINGSLIDVLKSPVTRIRLILAVWINFCCAIAYYGLSLNVVNLKTNLYFNVLLNAIAEMPAFTITAIMLDKFGRKPLTVGTMWFSAFFCLCGSLMKSSGVWKTLRMICGVLGIFGMAGTYNLLFIYTVELFPTVVRNAALGCTTQASQMGAILAPLVVVTGGGFPFVVFAMCGFMGGLLGFYLPETLNRPLYDTMTGMEEGETNLLE